MLARHIRLVLLHTIAEVRAQVRILLGLAVLICVWTPLAFFIGFPFADPGHVALTSAIVFGLLLAEKRRALPTTAISSVVCSPKVTRRGGSEC